MGIGVVREGRVLKWRPAVEVAYSDLSTAHPRRAFPHLFHIRLAPDDEGCTVSIAVTGRWTATLIGRPLARLWLGWHLLKIRVSLEAAVLRYVSALRVRGGSSPRSRAVSHDILEFSARVSATSETNPSE